MQCLVRGLRMKFSSLSELDAWVTMQLNSSGKKLARDIFVLQLMVQIVFCLCMHA